MHASKDIERAISSALAAAKSLFKSFERVRAAKPVTLSPNALSRGTRTLRKPPPSATPASGLAAS